MMLSVGERADVTTDQCGPTDGARVSRNCPCGCPSCIGYNSVLPNPFPTPYMSARTSTLGRWSTRQRQRPALPEAELGWQIESTCLTLAPTSPVSAHGFRAAPPPRSDPSLTPARQVRHQWRRTPSPSDLVETTRPSRHSREPPTQSRQRQRFLLGPSQARRPKKVNRTTQQINKTARNEPALMAMMITTRIATAIWQ